MGMRMKSYLAFTTIAYKVVLFILAPLAAIGIQVLLAPMEYSEPGPGLYLTAVLMVELEIVMDYWAFGAVAAKGNGCLEYLKTSARGLKLMKTALWQDAFRVFAECLLVLSLGMAAHHLVRRDFAGFTRQMEAGETLKLLAIAMAAYFVAMSGQLITRYFDNIQVNMVVAALTANSILLFLLWMVNLSGYFMLAALTIFSVTISVLGLRQIMTRVEESYYDEKL